MSLVSQDHKQLPTRSYHENYMIDRSTDNSDTYNRNEILLNEESTDLDRLTTRILQPQVRRKKRKWKQPRQVFKQKKTNGNNDRQDEEKKTNNNKNKHNSNSKQEESNSLKQTNPLFLNFNDQNFDLPFDEKQNNFLVKIKKLLIQKTKLKDYSKTELLELGLPQKIIDLNRNNCLNFKFSFQELDLTNILELLKSTKNCVINFTKQGIGFEEIQSRFILYILIVKTKEHPSNEWIKNHYQRIVYECAANLRLYPKQLLQLYQKKLYFTPLHILNKLKARYRKEFTEKKQSPLSQIIEDPSLLTKGIALEISSIQKQEQQSTIQTMTETEMEDFFSIFDQFEQEKHNDLKKKNYSTTATATAKITPTHTTKSKTTSTTTSSFSTSSQISSTLSSAATTLNSTDCTEKASNLQKYRIELTDGWYSIKALFDKHLLTLIDEGKLIEGSRLQILNSQLSGFDKVTSTLDCISSDICLSLSFNCTKIVNPRTKLGFSHPNQQLTPTSISLLKPNGGMVPCIDIIIQRKSPLWLSQKKYNSKLLLTDPIQRNKQLEMIFSTNQNHGTKNDENGGSVLNSMDTSFQKNESITDNTVKNTDKNENQIKKNIIIKNNNNNTNNNTQNCSDGDNNSNNSSIDIHIENYTNTKSNYQECNNSSTIISNSNINMSIIQNDNLVQNKNSEQNISKKNEQNVNNQNNNINNKSNTNNNVNMDFGINGDSVNNNNNKKENQITYNNNNNQKEWWDINNKTQNNDEEKNSIINQNNTGNSRCFFELEVIDYNNNSTKYRDDRVIHVWDDSIQLWKKLKEGSRVKIYNLDSRIYSGFNENPQTSFSTNNKTKIEILTENVNQNLFIPRVLTNLPSLMSFKNQLKSLNFIGVLIYYSKENSIYYLADENLILAKIHLSPDSDNFFINNSIVGSTIIIARDICPEKFEISTKVLTFETNKYSLLTSNNQIETHFLQRYTHLSNFFNSDLGNKHKLHLMGHVDCLETDFDEFF
ncbi:breast cancer type 2 susceptibility protein [Anaeramoeba flamelloides]|uniref:Breast cancer type 2 susceptibility protein n=1 Tax=Anaeramoeba flamelloides TaxID=1746091 RepID=A0AAV8ADJ6_9EUKA|nr:breast cancer type 2 susceptibility protein [Anaeramoeba flamelloides]